MPTEFAVLACATTYADSQNVVYETCHHFVRCYGGEFEECLSIANEVYTKLYWKDDWKEKKSSFKTWLRRKITYALLEDMRLRRGRNNRLPKVDLELEFLPTEKVEDFDLQDFLDYLSEDARVVAEMVLTESIPLTMEVYQRGDFTPKNVLRALGKVLSGLGWTSKRILESFEEVKQAIST